MGKKPLVLLYTNDKRVNQHYCYKMLQSAIRKTADLVIRENKEIIIWDTERGQEVASVSRSRSQVVVTMNYPNTFRRLWSQ